ncbi:MAG: DinB family protein [Acidobacteria bacterium]|nr:DinB family protein [Acidobacteriota bacterium]
MNFYGAKELAASFRTVRNNTITIAEEIPAEAYTKPLAPGLRTVAQLLTHIAVSYRLQHQVHAVQPISTLEGFDFPGFFGGMMAEEQKPRDKAQLIQLLKENGELFAKWLESLSDSFLGEMVAMPTGMTPAAKSRFEMILSVKEHEMHHRGQLMMFERSLGQVPHLTRQFIAHMEAAQKK